VTSTGPGSSGGPASPAKPGQDALTAPTSLSAEDVQDILRLLDTLPFDELTLETGRFTLRLQRAADGGWAQETTVAARPAPAEPAPPTGPAPQTGPAPPTGTAPAAAPPPPTGPAPPTGTGPTAAPPPPTQPAPSAAAATATGPAGQPASQPAGAAARGTGTEAGPGRDVREVRAPLLGTFYRAPQPGAPPYVEIGSQVAADTVVAIIETMKLMNPVYAGTAGTVSEICLDDGQFAEQDAVLMRVSARAG
jgi:acetyl-CoA carboxylase biotin carboxyl carrier protein